MRRLIKNRLRSSFKGSFRRMFDPTIVVGLKGGRVMTKYDGLAKKKIVVNDVLPAGQMIFFDIKNVDLTTLPVVTHTTKGSFYSVATINLTDGGSFDYGCMAVSSDKKPVVLLHLKSQTDANIYGYYQACGDFVETKYGYAAILPTSTFTPWTIKSVNADIYYIEEVKLLTKGLKLAKGSTIYFSTNDIKLGTNLFNDYYYSSDGEVKEGTTTLAKEVDGFVIKFQLPSETEITSLNVAIIYYEEA
jgi:hypothetical protein